MVYVRKGWYQFDILKTQKALSVMRMHYIQDIISYIQVLGQSTSYTFLELEQFTINQVNMEWEFLYVEYFVFSETVKQHSRTV